MRNWVKRVHFVGIGGAGMSGIAEVLLNLAAECPPFFERHERLLEVVAQDDEDKRAGRARYAFYRDRGYAIRNHDLANVTSSAGAGVTSSAGAGA